MNARAASVRGCFPPSAPTKILVIDDTRVSRLSLTGMLKKAGHRILEASNGVEGLAIARAEHPDMVISDVIMPVMDGDEFARRRRPTHP